MASASPSRGGVSPSSSPRLPSPPPFTEVQFGPKSPSIGASITELELEAAGKSDEGASRRTRPGSKAVDMAKGPPFVPLHQLESAFQLQEYLKLLYHKLTHDDQSNTVQAVTKEMAIELATPPTAADTGETVDRNLWLYELCRFLCSKTTRMIVAFFADNPPCSGQTCPEMRASEWQYLCAVHEPPKSCCAIDYCNHTLDWASNILTSTKHFPSRLSLGGEGTNAFQSMRQLTNIFRRVYRIYAHAWFQHREVFWAIEAEIGLYMFFKTVCDIYKLIPEDNYTIPPEAEGHPEDQEETPVTTQSPQRMQVLQKEGDKPDQSVGEPQANTTVSTGATTRRHKHTPSTGAPIAVIAEGTEEDEEPSEHGIAELGATDNSTSPSKMSKGPGRIELPVNTDPDRAPEDPTPIALHEFNPLGSTIHEDSATEIPLPQPTAPNTDVASVPASEPGSQTVVSQKTGSFKEGGPDVLNAILGHMDDGDDTGAQDSDNETQIAIEDSKEEQDTKSTEEDENGNETMERIELPSTISNVTDLNPSESTNTESEVEGKGKESGASTSEDTTQNDETQEMETPSEEEKKEDKGEDTPARAV